MKDFYHLNFCLIHLNAFTRHFMSEYNTLSYHKMTFFPIQYQVCLDASLKGIIQSIKTIIKRFTRNIKIIHKYLYLVFNHVRKNRKHAPLKCCWRITSSKRHPPIRKWTCEWDFFLVIRIYPNLFIPWMSIHKTIVTLSS